MSTTLPEIEARLTGPGAPFEVIARRVVLAAGSLGSTEILMRARDRGLPLSRMLGQAFSANGDAIAVGHDWPRAVHAVADEDQPPASRQVGPTITGVLDGFATFWNVRRA